MIDKKAFDNATLMITVVRACCSETFSADWHQRDSDFVPR